MKRIVLTGGGTAGHVTPNLAIIPELKSKGLEVHYIGQINGIEQKLVEGVVDYYHHISAGKLRRYFDFKNFTDVFKIVLGVLKSIFLLLKIKPGVVFSKGGFVSCPVVWASWLLRIPVIIHESDLTPGLTNRLSAPFAKKICYSFPETIKYINSSKAVYTGIPVRSVIQNGNASQGKKICNFKSDKPVLLIVGGSLGSKVINDLIRENIDTLSSEFSICHICGQNGLDESLMDRVDYRQFEYVDQELPDFFAMADLVISRAGATILFELLAVKKPSLLIPLSKKASRGDQILNAKSFAKQGLAVVVEEESLSEISIIEKIQEIIQNKDQIIQQINQQSLDQGNQQIFIIIDEMLNY